MFELVKYPIQPNHIKSLPNNEMWHIKYGNRKLYECLRIQEFLNSQKVLAHMKGKIAKNEYSYEHPVLQTHNIYLLEHKYKGYK